MNNIIDTFADLAKTAAGLTLDHARTLLTAAGAALLLLGWLSVVNHLSTVQALNVAMFDQLTRPQPVAVAVITAAPTQQWVPVQ